MKSTVLVALFATMSAQVAAVEPNQPSPPSREVACAPKLNLADDPSFVPPAVVDRQQIQREVQSILDAFTAGKVHGIDIVSSYAKDQNSLTRVSANNSLMNASMSGPGVDKSMEDLEDRMTELSKMMALYTPEALNESNEAWYAPVTSFFNRGKNRAKSITASFASNEQKVVNIIQGLGDTRASLLVDVEILESEITRLRDKIDNIRSQSQLWKAREEALQAFLAQTEEKLSGLAPGSDEHRDVSNQIDILKTEILLPISQTISMLGNQTDIFNASVMAQRGQQDQNKLIIRTGENLERTAAEVLPTMVKMAVTAARAGRAISIQQGAKTLMEDGLAAIGKQMQSNADRARQMMEQGPLSQEKIFAFSTEVMRIVNQGRTDKIQILDKLADSRERRERFIAEQAPMIAAIRERVQFGELPSPDDPPRQITGQ